MVRKYTLIFNVNAYDLYHENMYHLLTEKLAAFLQLSK